MHFKDSNERECIFESAKERLPGDSKNIRAENESEKEKETKPMLEKMKSIIAEQLSCEAENITEQTSFKEDLGADSLDLFELVMALEDNYNVEIPSEDLEGLTTVGAVMDYLKSKGVEA